MRLRDRYKGATEGGVIAILQAPGEPPIKVDLLKGFNSTPEISDPKSNENGTPPNEPTR